MQSRYSDIQRLNVEHNDSGIKFQEPARLASEHPGGPVLYDDLTTYSLVRRSFPSLTDEQFLCLWTECGLGDCHTGLRDPKIHGSSHSPEAVAAINKLAEKYPEVLPLLINPGEEESTMAKRAQVTEEYEDWGEGFHPGDIGDGEEQPENAEMAHEGSAGSPNQVKEDRTPAINNPAVDGSDRIGAGGGEGGPGGEAAGGAID